MTTSLMAVLLLALMSSGCSKKSSQGPSIGPGGHGGVGGGCFDEFCYGATEFLGAGLAVNEIGAEVSLEMGLQFFRTDGPWDDGLSWTDYRGGAIAEGYLFVESDSTACNLSESRATIRRGFYMLNPVSSTQWSDSGVWNITNHQIEAIHESGRSMMITIKALSLKAHSARLGRDGFEYQNGMVGELSIDSVQGISCNIWGWNLNVLLTY